MDISLKSKLSIRTKNRKYEKGHRERLIANIYTNNVEVRRRTIMRRQEEKEIISSDETVMISMQ